MDQKNAKCKYSPSQRSSAVQASILGISNKIKLGSFRFEEVTLSESNHLEIAIAEDNVDKLRTLLNDQE